MTALAKYDAMIDAITAAHEVDEVKSIRDQAVALEHYARQAKNVEAERKACEIRLRAERKVGQITKKIEKSKGGRPKKESSGAAPSVSKTRGAAPPVSKKALLKAAGVTVDQAKQWEKLAAVPDEVFDEALISAEMPTTIGIITATAEPKDNPVADDAAWLWGKLKAFQSHGLLDKDPMAIMATMTDAMKDKVHILAPRVASWLRRIGAVETGRITQVAAEVPSSSPDVEYPELPNCLRRVLQ
jgi:hypothetical protein